ncbi:hypothetical protein Tco_1542281 [Tanacetum coccineum]
MVHRQRSLSLKEVSVKEIPSPRFSFLLWWWLFKSILEACDKGFYKGVYLAKNKSNISLLKYADDALFSSDWSRLNASNLIHILKCFELASGLKVNITKSRLLGVGAPCNKVELMASSLGCAHDSLPFTYLGLSVGKKMRGCDGWNSIISRFRDMLSSWKAKYLLIGAQKVINILEAIRCIFFWGFKDSQRGISWVKWNTILLDMDKGGLGVGSLLAKNLGLLRKWKLRFLTENNSLWRKVINEFYGNDRGFGSSPSFYHVGGIWHDINKAASSIGNIVFSIWKAFGENTRDMGSFREETDKTTNLHQHLSRISTQKLETASQITRDVITTHLKTTSQDLQTVSDCMTQPII